MINLKVLGKYKKLLIECEAGIASSVLYQLSAIDKKVDNVNGKCVIEIDMKYIEECSKALASFKGKVIFDGSFIEWKNKYRGKTPVLIRTAIINSKIYGTNDFKIPHTKIEEVTRYFFKPAVNMKSYKDKKWDGYIVLYKRWLHQFPTGLLDRVLKVLDDEGIPYHIEKMYEEPKRQFDWTPIKLFEPSEDQIEAVDIALKMKRGVMKAATGFGRFAL